MNTIHLDPNQVPPALRGAYNGKKFKAIVCTETAIPSDAGLWSGGSRDHYHAINLYTGMTVQLPGQQSSPWNEARREINVTLEPGLALVRHSMFRGKDMGLTFYVHPDNAAKLLPAPTAELSEHELIVLDGTCSYKSSHNGRDRYQITCVDRISYGQLPKMTREQWDAAKQSLISKGLLNKAGAVTPAGRNARPSRY